ncbi:MAG: tssA [Burkholderia sp.]|nr:tssA [Burkholderia sp.]
MDSKWEGILEPVSEAAPCGEDMSFSPEFDLIREARREDDPTIDYGEWQAALKHADWPKLIASCTELLQNRSKDLRLSAWLTEGLVKTSGLSGLGDGIEITAQLLDRFGPDIHPQADDGDQEQRIGSLSWLVVRIAQLVRQIPITRSKSGSFSLNDYESARMLRTQIDRNPDATSDLENRVTLDKFTNAVAKTDKTLYKQWMCDMEGARSAINHLMHASDALFGLDGPSFGPLSESLDAVHLRLESICRERGILSAPETGRQSDPQSPSPDNGALDAPMRSEGPIANRTQALDLLRQVATFFRNTEPHSPVAYLADKAAYWGAMPLHAWLRSVVKDTGTLAHIEELLGVEPAKDSAEE